MRVAITGISIIALIGWVICMFMGEWESAMFAVGIIFADCVINTYLEKLRTHKSKGQL